MSEAPELDTGHAHSARVYNYWLGGKDNFAADREAAEQAIAPPGYAGQAEWDLPGGWRQQ